MAPSRGKGKASVYPLRKSSAAQSTRRTPRRAAQRNDGVPPVYKDMLAEASENDADDMGTDRPLKKRKIADSSARGQGSKMNLQTVEDSSASSDDSDDSEFEFEDVDLHQASLSSPQQVQLEEDNIADVSVVVDTAKVAKRASTAAKRKAATPAEKAHRLMVHRLHILCSLGHVMYVNTWCNDPELHKHLRKLVPVKTQSYLKHNPEHSQFQRNRSFMDGLQQATEMWRGAFKITASGLRRPKWLVPDEEAEQLEMDPLDRSAFKRAAKDFEGSQDMGNQLFCALLRALDVDARMVCSLQVLPFAATSKDKSRTPQKDVKKTIYATPARLDSPATDSNTEDTAMKNSSTVGKVPSARRRLGQPAFDSALPAANITPNTKRQVRRLTHPVFWVEAFNRAHQTWIPVDPLMTQTVGKASKLEPPSSYEWNQMSYVIAFESDGVARDVTKRYAKAYNAKTRRLRIESVEQNGVIWLRKALRLFRRPRPDGDGRIRDQIEDGQLAQREAQEGLPNNVQDFKHHPYYALERHTRRHEVIHPHREVGKVNSGTAAKPRMEAVFRRSDVQACKSAEKWFRVGREIKEGEQPLKRVPARRTRPARATSEDPDGEEVMISALYAQFQTQLYTPPSVVKGKVPRNAYGNLDIYVPSMVPPGGVHIRHPLAKEAARTLRVDAVDAVTGFKFQGRQGTAIIEGVIIPSNSKEAVEAVVDGLQDEQTEQEGMGRSVLALKMWKRFLTALRIKERVSAYGVTANEVDDDVDMADEENGPIDSAGGFLTEGAVRAEDSMGLSTAGKYSLAELLNATPTKSRAKKTRAQDTDESGEAKSSDSNDSDEEEDGFVPEISASRTLRSARRVVVDDESEDVDMTQPTGLNEEDEPGGFLPDDDMAGGFVAENDMAGGFVVQDDKPLDNDLATGHESDGRFMDKGSHEQEIDDAEELDFSRAANTDDNHIEAQTDVPMIDGSPTATSPIAAPLAEATEPSGGTEVATAEDHSLALAAKNSPEISGSGKDADASARLEWQVHGLTEAEQHEWPAEADDSDQGSMLSHDPEDEDAEPDWLQSD